jgi:elongation factor 1-gamma
MWFLVLVVTNISSHDCFAVANEELRGANPTDAACIQQWINFADSEILPASCTWVFPCMGIMAFNKQVWFYF